MMRWQLAVLIYGLAVGPLAAADPERGAKLFHQCSGCHMVGPEAGSGVGPHLNEVFGRPAGALEDYCYSDELVEAGANGLTWTRETLDRYLEDPGAFVTDTWMAFRGVSDPSERADLIAYLRRFSASPRDIPEAEPTMVRRDPDLDPKILAIKGDPAYGEYLAGECKTCHRTDGADDGIPSITGWPDRNFVVAMHAYKSAQRPHPVMRMIAASLADDEIAALAAYFSGLRGRIVVACR